jgi:hypothetical protein
VSFAAITLCIASQRVLIFVVYFVIDSVRKRLDTPSCVNVAPNVEKKEYVPVHTKYLLLPLRRLRHNRQNELSL